MQVYLHDHYHAVSIKDYLRCLFSGLLITLILGCLTACNNDTPSDSSTPSELPKTGLEMNNNTSNGSSSGQTGSGSNIVAEGASETVITSDGSVYQEGVIVAEDDPQAGQTGNSKSSGAQSSSQQQSGQSQSQGAKSAGGSGNGAVEVIEIQPVQSQGSGSQTKPGS